VSDGRKRIAALTTLCITAVGGSVLAPTPSVAEPTIPEARERADRLYREAEQASERYNGARMRLRHAERRLERVHAALEEQQERVDAVREQVVASVLAYYQGESLTAASQLVLSDDPDTFISQMTTVSEYTEQQAAVAEELAAEVDRLERREQAAESTADSIARTKRTLAKEKAIIDEKASDAEALVERLEEEREQRLSRSGGRTLAVDVEVSGRAAAAVQYALAQVGDGYAYGAAGPSAFDCSGLTMMAWAAAGVALPHSSGAQMGYGTPVSSDALQPGDLVFYYSPVSHVGIYIGNGMIVHAANPSTGVRQDPVFLMPYSGAVRPG
jgi:cell wall-associated NlpC family hydrolase